MSAASSTGAAWSRVWGHETALQALQRALRRGRLSPSVLLSGPPSVGKTLVAEVLAQSLLCTASASPCGSCPSCQAVARRSHPDGLWLEPPGPTTAIPIETVREALHRPHHTPVASARHVAVVLAIEQLSEEAATTLLKTVEEPPATAQLILTTQDLGRCLPTIVSRCQLVRLAPLGREALAARLVAERHVPAALAQRIAVLAEGRAGAALALIEHSDLPTVDDFFEQLTAKRDWSSDRREELVGLCEQYLWWCRDRLCALAGCAEVATTTTDTAHAPTPHTLEESSAVLTEAVELLEALEHRVNPKLIHWTLQQRWLSAKQP